MPVAFGSLVPLRSTAATQPNDAVERARQLAPDRAGLELGGVDVEVIGRGACEHRRDEGTRRRGAPAGGAVRAGCRERHDDGAGDACCATMDVHRDGGRKVLRRHLVAELPLTGAEADRRRRGRDGIAGRASRPHPSEPREARGLPP